MKNQTEQINLGQHKKHNATAFTGRPQGRAVREILKLNEKDRGGGVVNFILPSNTTSFNPSFFLGLLYDSYKHYQGTEAFDEHYIFDLTNLPPDFQEVIRKNLEDGKRNASNSYDSKGVLNFS